MNPAKRIENDRSRADQDMPVLQLRRAQHGMTQRIRIFRRLLTRLGALLLAATPAGALLADMDMTACTTTDDLGARLTCDLRYIPDEDERAAIRADSGGLIEDLRCVVAIDIARKEAATMAGAASWTSPPQQVGCEVVAASRRFDARFLITAEVSLIGDSRAIGAKLNLDDIEGLPPLIANAIATHIRFNSSFQERILSAINRHLDSWLDLADHAAAARTGESAVSLSPSWQRMTPPTAMRYHSAAISFSDAMPLERKARAHQPSCTASVSLTAEG